MILSLEVTIKQITAHEQIFHWRRFQHSKYKFHVFSSAVYTKEEKLSLDRFSRVNLINNKRELHAFQPMERGCFAQNVPLCHQKG